ncbi:MAG: GbsR/MarR family transcriptional regulator [Solirubrobacteraceae bacterium]
MVTRSAELGFSAQVGRHFARQYGMPPMVGRVAGWLMICEPEEQTAAEIADALGASRSAVGAAVATLESFSFGQRVRAVGERSDRVRINPEAGAQGLQSPAEFGAMAALARHGLEVLDGEPISRRARLLEVGAFYEWLLARMPSLAAEWSEHRDALRATGELPQTETETERQTG